MLVNLMSVTELLLAELIFLFGLPKRNYFPLRLIAAVAAVELIGVASYFVEDVIMDYAVLMFLLLVIKIIFTIFFMMFCFKGSAWILVSACVGGVAVQHIGYQVSVLVTTLFFPQFTEGGQLDAGVYIVEMLSCAAVYIIFVFTFGIPLAKKHYYDYYDKRMIILSVIIVLVCTGIIRIYRDYAYAETEIVLCVCAYAITCNLLALFFMFFLYRFITLQNSYIVLRHIHEEEARQYENSKVNSKLLNIKCHDLKKYMHLLGNALPADEAGPLKEAIEIYGGTFNSGVEALDVIVNEKLVQCISKGIAFTLLGDGKIITFMNTIDIYSLFVNMIDNAMDAVEKLPEAEDRAISIVIEERGELVVINSVNYTNQTYSYEEGLPRTTKSNELGYHGYGLKSMQMIAEKYGGDIAVTVQDGVFSLSIYMLPSAAEENKTTGD